MKDSYLVRPIGHVRSTREQPLDDDWDAIEARIELDPSRFGPQALFGLDAFSHIEVLFIFDRVSDDKIETGARHPRGRKDWPEIGIFAQRGKNRPNRLGATVCTLVGVHGLTLTVRGLDAIDGTPVLDIKPQMSGFERRGELREPAWAAEIMTRYWHD